MIATQTLDLTLEKRLIWLYFMLVIFEGGLRKWLLPSLSTPLLVVREPVALLLIFLCIKNGTFPLNPFLYGLLLIGIAGFFAAIFAGHGSMPVAIYGCRVFLIHFPVIFIMGTILDRQDVLEFGRLTLKIAIPMAILLVFQFYSPQSAWVNRGVGGDSVGAGFSGAMGYYRPPGTFSFTIGTTLFFGFAACFVFYFWLYPMYIQKTVLWLATAALIIAIPVSISRGLFFQVGVVMIFAIIASATSVKNAAKIISSLFVVLLLIAALSQTPVFQNSTEAFTSRFTTASATEGGLEGTLGDRYLGGMLAAFTGSHQVPFWGYGAGMGSNVGSMLLTGSVQYLVAEGEWGRMAGEFGPFLGSMIIFLRLGLAWHLSLRSYQSMRRKDLLPWLLLGFALLMLPQGSTAQPTSLGFLVMIAGLLLAALNNQPAGYAQSR